MKQALKNEIDMIDLMNKIQAQLIALDKKIDTLMNRPLPETRQAAPKPPVERERVKHTAICADCKKECTLPFKPSGDRPVYCQDCFSRRKVIRLSGMTTIPTDVPKPQVKTKKALAVKKPAAKKKPAPKKK